ncbi:MAG: BRCT domain-containing protein, partial [Thiotrichaceae bacterium]
MQLKLSDLTQAWAAKDPSLVDYIIALSQQIDSAPKTPIRAEALTFKQFLQTSHNRWEMQKKSKAEQYAWRVTQWQLLEADDAEAPLPERLKLYKILFLLWQDDSLYARHVLLEVIQRIPLVYGAWRALKHIFKASEQRNDYVLLGAIAARLDAEAKPEFSQGT